jgi:hypothetical protein
MPKRHPSPAPLSQSAAASKPTADLAPPAIAESHRPPVLSGAAAEKRCNALDAEYNARMQASLKEKYNTLSPATRPSMPIAAAVAHPLPTRNSI